MNLELLEHFGQNYPEEFDGALDCISLAVTCSFNRRGSCLAVGCNDGRIVIWDFLTRGMAKIISAHVHPVCSLSWSRNGHRLVSASTDNTVCLWDVLTSECVQRWRFFSPILRVQYNPRNDKMILICPLKHAAIVVFLPHKDGPTKTHVMVPLSDDEPDLNIVASFDRRGEYIYTGNAKGRVLVVKVGPNMTNLTVVASFRVASANTAVKQIEFAPRKKDVFLVSTADRIIRVYETEHVLKCGKHNKEPEPIQKLQDLVNKTMWKKCCFSGGPDADYICAGSARQHALYIWERSVGNLVKILHGTKGELLLDVVWHPIRPIIASISSGVVSIWAQPQVENWSAFAPDFKELDENVEYEERESEFDIEDEDRTPARVTQDNDDEDLMVDVVTPHTIHAFLSSDEEDEDQEALNYIPIAPDIDEPEIEGPLAPTPTEMPSKSSKKIKTIDIDLKEGPKDESHPLLSGPGKQCQRSVPGGGISTQDKSSANKAKAQRPSGKRAANGSSEQISNKRAKTKKSSDYYSNSSHNY